MECIILLCDNVCLLFHVAVQMEKTCDREPPICLEIAVMTDDVTGVNQQTQTLVISH